METLETLQKDYKELNSLFVKYRGIHPRLLFSKEELKRLFPSESRPGEEIAQEILAGMARLGDDGHLFHQPGVKLQPF